VARIARAERVAGVCRVSYRAGGGRSVVDWGARLRWWDRTRMKISIRVLGGAAAAACSACGSGVDRPAGVVTLETGSPPALVAFRDDLHPAWQGVPVRGAAAFDLAITGTYQVVVVCQSGGPGTSFAASVYARTPDDGDAFHTTCSNAEPFDLRGKMVQPGIVAFGQHQEGTTVTNWSLDFPTPP